ncbi:MAG: biotin synthase BioB, partial [Desulfatiglandales bacterium]
DLELLKGAGLTRYHHNIETAPSFYREICTTHSFEERLNTIKDARSVGLEVCSGGIFGMGESDEQIVEMALVLRDLDVDAVPCNFLTPISGTRLGRLKGPEPTRCLKIISLFRYALPKKEVIICGGRVQNLKELHPLVFYAGANAIMTGNYLTTTGRNYAQDIELIGDLKLKLNGTKELSKPYEETQV